jgi:NADH-quinone oxidoreductase subunit E
MARFDARNRARAEATIGLYPEARSAVIPLCHLAQSQDGYLTREAMQEIGELCGVTATEVYGTATFYEMLFTEPVGTHLIAICTNIACMLDGAYELLEHAEETLGVSVGQTTRDGTFTLEEAECLAGCDLAPCVQVNHRFVGVLDADGFDALVDDLRAGRRSDEIPRHGVLCRVERTVGLPGNADASNADAKR